MLHQVIVAQMEVFEKSLKVAQRNLLRKAEWGEGVAPQPEGQQEVTSSPSISSSHFLFTSCLDLRTSVCELYLPKQPLINDIVFIFFQNSEPECVDEESEDLRPRR